ncbi:MAG: response regulator [Elusimicrobiales bacterium]|jgi:CheY-like chemotaxis protein
MNNILIVDDDYSIRELYKYIFAELGYTVETAVNGREALEKIKAFKPDCMLVDISMPEMDGCEFIARLNRPPVDPALKKVPFIIMTGENYMDMKIQDAFQGNAACKGFMPKMSEPDSVARAIHEILSGSARER